MRNASGIDVSKEEEQFLRRAFRRFALPYVVVFAVVAWIASSFVSSDASSASPKEIASLREKLAALEKSMAALDGRLDEVTADLERAGTRVGALESRKPAPAPSGDTADLERELRDATRRVSDLERRNAASATADERIDALVARVQRIESAARASASSPAPVPMPAAPSSSPGP